ncbi:MAG: AI-2E family transporter [Bacillota bacterium]|nr:AI-2E family transporter [Bacillota bacterium]
MRPISKFQQNWLYIIGIAVLSLLVINFSSFIKILLWIWKSFSSVIYSFVVAYLLNIVMMRIERVFEHFPNGFFQKNRKTISLIGTLIVVTAFGYLLIALVVPQIYSAIQVIIQEIPRAYNLFVRYLIQLFDKNPQFQELLVNMEVDWSEVFRTIGGVLTIGIGSVLDVTFNIVGGAFTFIMNGIVILILSIYILIDKERFFRFFGRVCSLYMDKKTVNRLDHVVDVVNNTFSNFVVGKVIEAVILGGMIALGMYLMKLPYAVMVGTLVGAINIIPMIGAFIGGGIGAFMVFTVSPLQALIFLVYLCIVQQIEANLIYPKIAGDSLGLPGVGVLMSVIVCGSLGGIVGMLLGIPVVASVYKLLCERIEEKEKAEDLQV